MGDTAGEDYQSIIDGLGSLDFSGVIDPLVESFTVLAWLTAENSWLLKQR